MPMNSIHPEILIFKGGEPHCKISPSDVSKLQFSKCAVIEAHLVDSNKVLELALIVNAIRHINPKISLNLLCPYFPGARQDRVTNLGEPLSAQVYANFINGLNFDSVEVWDAHSDVTTALLNNVVNVGPEHFLNYPLGPNPYILVAPDAGAMKKVLKVAQKFDLPMITATKVRDTKTGNITQTKVEHYESTIPQKFLIVDDICDGGRTFIELSKSLHESHSNCSVSLYVTHGIFSRGLEPLHESGIEYIYCANLFSNVNRDDKLHLVSQNVSYNNYDMEIFL